MSVTAPNAAPFGKLERTLARRYLLAKREHGGASFISIISFVGIFFAVAALIITMSIMGGFRATLLNALLGGQPHVYASMEGYTAAEAGAFARKISAIEGVESVTPAIEQQVLVRANGRESGAVVRGVPVDGLDTLKFLERASVDPAKAGFGQGNFGGNTILMGSCLAQCTDGLWVQENDTIEIIASATSSTAMGSVPRRKVYRVGSLFSTGSGELDRLYIFMPMEQAQVFFNRKDRFDRLNIRLNDPYAVEAVKPLIQDATGYSLALGDWMTDRAAYLNALRIERTMVRLLVMIIMGIATLNIIVGVVMLVKNKARDIAILRTMGLSRNAVMRVFLMVGTVLGTLGALLGILIGVLFVLNIGPIENAINFFVEGDIFNSEVYGLPHLPAELNWNEVIQTGLYAIGMSALVSILPARWAARQDPVAALRFE